MTRCIGFQIVEVGTDNPPDDMTTSQVYPLDFCLDWFRALTVAQKPYWRLLPIFDGDIDAPTFPTYSFSFARKES
jgi:hypothetical protein